MRGIFLGMLLIVGVPSEVLAAIPATPVMTVYQFNGPRAIPYYDTDRFAQSGPVSPVGQLSQGTSLIPCLVIRDGLPLTDRSGTPYVGFEVVVDSREAAPAATERFKRAVASRARLKVRNHHCSADIRYVVSARKLYALTKPPSFEPPRSGRIGEPGGSSRLDRIVRAFHASSECGGVNTRLMGRRAALGEAWEQFIRSHSNLGSATELARARHLDYAMRTALFEGHIGRGCNAYGACERNVVLLSIRNRAVGQCWRGRGCRFPGDFQGVSSAPDQYNIWDEYLTQISGLTSCFLRPDLARKDEYQKLQAMYEQTLPDAERILFGGDTGLRSVFPDNGLAELSELRHYYHAPAMGKCFPDHERVEYMSGAVAHKGEDYALIADTRIEVGEKRGDAYAFKQFTFEAADERDIVRVENSYPGFVVDARKVALRRPTNCTPYGMPAGCDSGGRPGRYRKVPSWLHDGRPLELHCRVSDLGSSCRSGGGSVRAVSVGGRCDREMRPVTGVR